MRNFLVFAGVVFVLIVGGYLGYKVFVKGEPVDKAVDNLSNKIKVESTTKERANIEKFRGNYELAIDLYKQAIGGSPKPTAEDQRDMEWYIAECYYEMATRIGRTAGARSAGEKGIKAYEDYIKKYPTDSRAQPAYLQVRKLREHPNLQ
ncbi:MAG: hypothetical protein HZA50_16815 [Planctomycetes bacterium]|nr:hypothetical protein [Planctomycetota bacterium]